MVTCHIVWWYPNFGSGEEFSIISLVPSSLKFYILISFSEITGTIWTKLGRNADWIALHKFKVHTVFLLFKAPLLINGPPGKALIWKAMDNRRRTLNDNISTIFLLNVGTVPTVWYIFFHFIIVLFIWVVV